MIELLTFDLDNTLWETDSVVAAAERTLLDWLQQHAPLFSRLDAEARRAVRREVIEQHPELRYRVTPLRIAILQHGLLRAGYPEQDARELALAGFQVFLDARHQLELFPHAEQLLRQLSRHYLLASISNGNADVRRLGLDHYFKAIVSADEVGVGKPHPEPFLTALQTLGVEPEHALHIGDHPEDDMRGARQVGMHTLWFNGQGKPWPDQPRPDGEVRCLSEVEGWLEQYQNRR